MVETMVEMVKTPFYRVEMVETRVEMAETQTTETSWPITGE